jgi:NTE family protein
VWFLYSNEPLKRSIEKFAKFPIATSPGEPRLLLVAVDVLEGETVTFDSYAKYDDGIRKTVYGKGERKYSIEYQQGITIEHVMASASVPIYFDYTAIEAKDTATGTSSKRFFWDGGLLSNTPLREVISEHKLFWEKKIGHKNLLDSLLEGDKRLRVPNLEVYIVNVWPSTVNEVPLDHDSLVNRKNDIIFHDKTPYDEKVAVFVTDYIDLASKLIDLAKQKGASRKEIENVLNSAAKSKFRTGEQRSYKDLLIGRFDISRSIRIELADEDEK